MLCYLWGKKKGSSVLNLNFIYFLFTFQNPGKSYLLKKNIKYTLDKITHLAQPGEYSDDIYHQ